MTSPSAETASAAPGSRGALRYVFVTVARPNVCPVSHHGVIFSRMSRTTSPRPCCPTCFRLRKTGCPTVTIPGAGRRLPRTGLDGRRGRADQVGDVRIGGTLVGPEILGRQPGVLVGAGLLQRVQAVEGHLGGLDEQGIEGLALDDVVAGEGELDRVVRDRLAESFGGERDAGFLSQLADARLGQRLAAPRAAADGEPERCLGMIRIPAVQQQHPALRVNGQHPGGLPAPGGRRHRYSTILEMGISRMSWAPAALSAGIRVLTPRLGTTVSTAFISPRASVVIVGEDRAGSISVTAASRSAATLSFSRTFPRAWIAPRSSSAMSSMAARLASSA